MHAITETCFIEIEFGRCCKLLLNLSTSSNGQLIFPDFQALHNLPRCKECAAIVSGMQASCVVPQAHTLLVWVTIGER